MSPTMFSRPLSRRRLLGAGAGWAAAHLLLSRGLVPARAETPTHELVAAPGRARLLGFEHPDTAVWAYSGQVPGPAIRVRQGSQLRVAVTNGLDEETTIHWHGIRTPNAMDGVPHLTQKPIAPGETFVYEFDVPDAGTFWYHPHQRSYEQVGRGLYAPLIVEEREPIQVDRDVTWVLDDWRLLRNAAISDDFGTFMDLSHGGRVGNTVTINGRAPDTVPVRAGERVRLRLINAANGRIFGLRFDGLRPRVIALDGHGIEPHEPEDGRVVLAPAQRMDLVLDMTGAPGERQAVTDGFYRDLAYQLIELAYTDEPPLRNRPLDAPVRLPDNPVAEPDLDNAIRHEVTLGGGMNGTMAQALFHGHMTDLQTLTRHGMAWAINGVVASSHVHDPVFMLAHGQTCAIALNNDTDWHHPFHLHGHTFRVLSRNGRPTRYREWQDTVLLAPHERVEIAFVADNPGDWMLHCHIPEHQAAGMMSTIRIA